MHKAWIVCLGIGLAAGPAAGDGLYAELQIGSSSFQDADLSGGGGSAEVEYDPGFTVGGAVGGRMLEGLLRAEGAVSYRRAEIDEVGGANVSSADADLGVTALLGNVYLDIPVSFPIKPYVGGGFGVAIFTPDNAFDDDEDARVAGSLMVGGFYPVMENLELDLRYRWLASDDPEFDNVDLEFRTHEVVAAVRVLF